MQKGTKAMVLGLVLLIAVLAAGVAMAGRAVAQCRDGVDNDGDTFKDYPADPGCSSRSDNSELSNIQCDNGLDDDGDNLIDYPDDTGCSSPTDNSEFIPGSCSDSDGGFQPLVAGTVNGTQNGVPFSYSDFCETSTVLREYWCSGTVPVSGPQNCAGNATTQCINGACV